MEYRSAISAAAFGLLALLAAVPESAWAAIPPVCLFRGMFGIECLGCGMTRALSAALHGHFIEAFAWNAGVVAAAPALIGAALLGLWRRP